MSVLNLVPTKSQANLPVLLVVDTTCSTAVQGLPCMGGGFTRFTPNKHAWIPYAIMRSNQGNYDEQCSINEESQYGNNGTALVSKKS